MCAKEDVNAKSLLKFFWICLVWLSYCCGNSAAWNYFCKDDAPCQHVLCNLENITGDGTFVAHVPRTLKLRRLFLEKHNNLRDKIAGEKMATRMRNLIWDHELSYIARAHGGRCASVPSPCVYTARFPHAAMLAHAEKGAEPLQIVDVIAKAMTAWEPQTFLTHDQGAHLGCSVSYCSDCGSKHCYVVTCMYDVNDKITPQFATGTGSATKCEDWNAMKSSKYVHLCRNTGKRFEIKKSEPARWFHAF